MAGLGTALGPSAPCDATCRGAPAACLAARRIVEQAPVQRTIARAVLSTIEDPAALDRVWADVVSVVRSRLAPSVSMALTVASTTPASAPFQPAWAAPITRADGSTNSTGPQSAAVTPIARLSVRVTIASTRGRDAVSHGAVAVAASGE